MSWIGAPSNVTRSREIWNGNEPSRSWSDGCAVSINLIPHTLEVTTLGSLKRGSRLNLEIDLLARYVERLNTEIP